MCVLVIQSVPCNTPGEILLCRDSMSFDSSSSSPISTFFSWTLFCFLSLHSFFVLFIYLSTSFVDHPRKIRYQGPGYTDYTTRTHLSFNCINVWTRFTPLAGDQYGSSRLALDYCHNLHNHLSCTTTMASNSQVSQVWSR